MSHRHSEKGVVGIALSAAAGFCLGVLAGVLGGELLGNVNPERMRRAVRRLGPDKSEPADLSSVDSRVLHALRVDPATRHLDLKVRVISEGLVELIGRVPSERVRDHAAEMAREAAGDDVVVNRLLVEETDVSEEAR